MQTRLNPYISFKGNAQEAMEFYKGVFGGKLTMSTFKEFYMEHAGVDEGDKIMHAMLEADNGIVLMGSDTPSGMEYQSGARINISLSGEDEAEIRGYWGKLSEGGNVTMPFDKAPWGDTFGMLVDKFGVQWMLNLNAKKE